MYLLNVDFGFNGWNAGITNFVFTSMFENVLAFFGSKIALLLCNKIHFKTFVLYFIARIDFKNSEKVRVRYKYF